jgi:hypothetical protein
MGDAHGGEANAAALAPSCEMLFDAAKFARDDVGRGNVSSIAERCEGDERVQREAELASVTTRGLQILFDVDVA